MFSKLKVVLLLYEDITIPFYCLISCFELFYIFLSFPLFDIYLVCEIELPVIIWVILTLMLFMFDTYVYFFLLMRKVPCVAVVENMCHFDADGKRYYPFGRGSGSQAWIMFLILNFYLLLLQGKHIDKLMVLNIKQLCNVCCTCLIVWLCLQVVQQFGIPHLFDLPIRPTVCFILLYLL